MPHSIPVDLPAMGSLQGIRCTMRIEEIGISRLLLRTKQMMRPHAQIELMCWIYPEERPVYAIVQAQYVEKTWAGYRIDAALCQMSALDAARWRQFFASASYTCAEVSNTLPTLHNGRQPQVLMIGNILSTAARTALCAQGLTVQKVPNAGQALELLSRAPDVLIADSSNPTVDILSLCRQVCAQKNAPDLLFLVDYAAEEDIDRYLNAGAARIILKPANQETLIRRITTTLAERAELQTASYASSTTLKAKARPAQSQTKPFDGAPGLWASLRWHLRSAVAHLLPSTLL